MTLTPDRPPEPRTVPYATPAARKEPPWPWLLLAGAGALVLLMLVLGGLLYFLRSQPQMAPPAATGGPAPATAPAGGTGNTRIEDGE